MHLRCAFNSHTVLDDPTQDEKQQNLHLCHVVRDTNKLDWFTSKLAGYC